ncbi:MULTISPECIES: MFS transporter [Paenibacillus]|uniref:MFS transporter n=1 Tax=Paenibacillus TaxID=44249 RepID=UPI0022B8E24A|nr:MFS transporter [Paenibacillus caseinilyticus]MCZ8522737.1 MFS transporter [Paenibacillus caseinilyticus]
MTLGNSMLIPTLPSMKRELAVTSFQISLIITLYSVVAIVLIPLAGYMSDRFGRKKIILPSLFIAGVGGLLCGTAHWFAGSYTFAVILIGRCIQGIGAAGGLPIVLPLVGDMFKKEKDVSSALGLVETSNTFGKVLSPVAGSLLALLSWYAVFLSIPVLCLISILLVAFLVKVPSAAEEKEKPKFKAFLHSLVDIAKKEGRWLSAIFIIGIIGMLVLFAVLFYLSSLLEDLFGIDGVPKGGLLALPLSALCLASYLTGKWIGEDKPRMKWVTVIGLVVLTGSMLAMAWLGITTLWMLLVIVGMGGIGIGIALPCLDALITEGIKKEQRGTVSSVYSSMRFIGVAAGPPLMSIGMKWPTSALFYSLGGVAILGVLTALLAIKPTQDAPKNSGSGGSGPDAQPQDITVFKPAAVRRSPGKIKETAPES